MGEERACPVLDTGWRCADPGLGTEPREPADPEGFVTTFQALRLVLFKDRYQDVEIEKYAVPAEVQDPMGHRTSDLYDFARMNRNRLIPLKGKQKLAEPHTWRKIDAYFGTTKPIPGGIRLLRGVATYFKNMLAGKQGHGLQGFMPGKPLGGRYLHPCMVQASGLRSHPDPAVDRRRTNGERDLGLKRRCGKPQAGVHPGEFVIEPRHGLANIGFLSPFFVAPQGSVNILVGLTVSNIDLYFRSNKSAQSLHKIIRFFSGIISLEEGSTEGKGLMTVSTGKKGGYSGIGTGQRAIENGNPGT